MSNFKPDARRRIARATRQVERDRPAGTHFRPQPPRNRGRGTTIAATVSNPGSPPLTSSGELIPFTTELYDSHNLWSPAANYKITFAEAGLGDYLVTWFGEFEADDIAQTEPFIQQPFSVRGLVNGTDEHGRVSGNFYQCVFPRGYQLWQLLPAGDSGQGLAIYDGWLFDGDYNNGGQDAINNMIADMQSFEAFVEAYSDTANATYHTQINEHYIWLSSAFIITVESLTDYLELSAEWSVSKVARVFAHSVELSILKINTGGLYHSPARGIPDDE